VRSTQLCPPPHPGSPSLSQAIVHCWNTGCGRAELHALPSSHGVPSATRPAPGRARIHVPESLHPGSPAHAPAQQLGTGEHRCGTHGLYPQLDGPVQESSAGLQHWNGSAIVPDPQIPAAPQLHGSAQVAAASWATSTLVVSLLASRTALSSTTGESCRKASVASLSKAPSLESPAEASASPASDAVTSSEESICCDDEDASVFDDNGESPSASRTSRSDESSSLLPSTEVPPSQFADKMESAPRTTQANRSAFFGGLAINVEQSPTPEQLDRKIGRQVSRGLAALNQLRIC